MVSIREGQPADAMRIAEIHVRSWQAAYHGLFPADYLQRLSVEARREQWLARFEKGSPWTVLVAEDEDEMLGWVSAGPSRDHDPVRNIGEIYALYVDPPCWRRGIGKALWSAVMSASASWGWDQIILWVLEGNHRARRFYEHVGFGLDSDQRRMYERDGHALPSVRYSHGLTPESPKDRARHRRS